MSEALGSGNIRQESIGENVNEEQVNKIYLSNIGHFKEFIESLTP